MIHRPRLGLLAACAGVLLLAGTACGAISQPQGWAAPVTTDGGWLTSLHKGKLAFTDETTRQSRWEFPNSNDATEKKISLQGIYGTPAIVGDAVYFGAYNGHVYKLGLADGKPQWKNASGGPSDVNTGASIVGNVAPAGDLVFAGNSDGKLVAIDANAGCIRGSYKAGERIWSSPVVNGDTLYVTSMDRNVYAFKVSDFAVGTCTATSSSPAAPKPQWTTKISNYAITSTPELDNGHLYFGSFDRFIHALDATSGKKVWSSSAEAGNWFWSHPLIQGSTIYVGNLDGRLYAVDTGTGKQIGESAALGDSIRGQPALAQGVLVVADRKGHMVGLDPTDVSKQVWSIELNSTTLGDLVVTQDQMILTVTEGGKSGSHLIKIDPTTGSPTVLA
jgi:outer membrane protein assembly factor BamB